MSRRPLASVHPIDIKPAEKPGNAPTTAQDEESLATSAVLIGAGTTNSAVSSVLSDLSNQIYGTSLNQARG